MGLGTDAAEFGLTLCGGAIPIVYNAATRELNVCGSIAPVNLIGEIKLHVFWDASVLGTFALLNGLACTLHTDSHTAASLLARTEKVVRSTTPEVLS